MFAIYLFKQDGSRIFQSATSLYVEANQALEVLKARFPNRDFRVI